MESCYTYVRFCGNKSKRWDGKCSEVPSKTIVKTGLCNVEGLEEADVHWPAKGSKPGKGGKVWKCVILPEEEAGSGGAGTGADGPSPKKQKTDDGGALTKPLSKLIAVDSMPCRIGHVVCTRMSCASLVPSLLVMC